MLTVTGTNAAVAMEPTETKFCNRYKNDKDAKVNKCKGPIPSKEDTDAHGNTLAP